MSTNEGTLDRVLRLIVGIALIIIGVMASVPTWTWVLIIVGIILTVTGAIGWCALYSVFGISTKKAAEAPPEPPPAE